MDYIFTLKRGALLRVSPTPKRIVSERSSIRSFAADYPIAIFFKPSRLSIFHLYVVVYNS